MSLLQWSGVVSRVFEIRQERQNVHLGWARVDSIYFFAMWDNPNFEVGVIVIAQLSFGFTICEKARPTPHQEGFLWIRRKSCTQKQSSTHTGHWYNIRLLKLWLQ